MPLESEGAHHAVRDQLPAVPETYRPGFADGIGPVAAFTSAIGPGPATPLEVERQRWTAMATVRYPLAPAAATGTAVQPEFLDLAGPLGRDRMIPQTLAAQPELVALTSGIASPHPRLVGEESPNAASTTGRSAPLAPEDGSMWGTCAQREQLQAAPGRSARRLAGATSSHCLMLLIAAQTDPFHAADLLYRRYPESAAGLRSADDAPVPAGEPPLAAEEPARPPSDSPAAANSAAIAPALDDGHWALGIAAALAIARQLFPPDRNSRDVDQRGKR
jgi:hypothetical protein